jgi:hypothetical protein
MTTILQEPATQPTVEKEPYKKRRKPCIICGKPSIGVTSFVFMADGRNKIGVPFCQLHLDNHEAFATPVFENQDALDLYKKEHPGLYNRTVKGKITLFLYPQKTSAASAQ